ncbi:MAG: L,D-transpeptidase family protein [Pseudomonadota bacterium]
MARRLYQSRTRYGSARRSLWLPLILLLALLVLGAAYLGRDRLAFVWQPVAEMIEPKTTVEEVLRDLGPSAMARLSPYLQAAGFGAALPERLRFVGLKEERLLEVWGEDGTGHWRPIRRYPVLAASGGPGPKLREGDGQVPEGRYPITLLNPNSAYHLSLRVGYPSPSDQAVAHRDGRDALGGDIMLHGGARSVGCLALGDPAIEEIFVLTALVGITKTDILLVPYDLRHRPGSDGRAWVQERYDSLRQALLALPAGLWPEPLL